MSYADRLRNQLNEKDLKSYIKKNPSTKNVRLKPGNYGSDNIRQKKRADAGTIDFYNYGGKKSKETRFEELMSGQGFLDKYRKGDKKNQEREDWKKVAKELGINKVDSESKVLRMIEHVRGSGSMASNEAGKEEPEVEYQPIGDIPSPSGGERTQQTNVDMTPRLDKRFTGDPSKDAVSGGDDLNDWYNEKFIPHLEAEANYGSEQIGFDSNYLLGKFVNAPFETGGVGKLYEKYKGDIKKAAD